MAAVENGKIQMGRILKAGTDLYAPIEILDFITQPKSGGFRRADAVLTLRWKGRKVAFVAQTCARTAPSAVRPALWELKTFAGKGKELLLIVPYLSPSVAELIEAEGVSALDLSGNYLIATKDLLAICRDRPNRYPEWRPIQAIYSGTSSIVGRFLLRENREYSSVNAIFKGIRERGGAEEAPDTGRKRAVSLSTISKVLKGLEDDLLVDRANEKIRIIQPEKLLDRLRENYKPPQIAEELLCKYEDVRNRLLTSRIVVWSGESSADCWYVSFIPSKIRRIYVTTLKGFEQGADDRFADTILQMTDNPWVYFDPAKENRASLIQCYLELSRLERREQEASDELRKMILEPFR